MPDIATQIRIDADAAELAIRELTKLQQARSRNRIDGFFPDTGPYRRELYPKHTAFFAAGGVHIPMIGMCPPDCDGQPHRERCFMAANRVGKTIAASYEVTLHATGLYPAWWPGRRFTQPVTVWAVNDTSYNTRDVNQLELLGPYDKVGTGMVPYRYIVGDPTKRQGIPQAYESFMVRHSSGGNSQVIFKSYEQGWEAFTGRAIEVIWADEEPPSDVYAEMCIRTMTTNGIILLTFTPLQGVTEVVQGFMEAHSTAPQSAIV